MSSILKYDHVLPVHGSHALTCKLHSSRCFYCHPPLRAFRRWNCSLTKSGCLNDFLWQDEAGFVDFVLMQWTWSWKCVSSYRAVFYRAWGECVRHPRRGRPPEEGGHHGGEGQQAARHQVRLNRNVSCKTDFCTNPFHIKTLCVCVC